MSNAVKQQIAFHDQLEMLSRLIDKVQEHLFNRNEHLLYEQLARDCQVLFNAESVGVFRVTERDTRSLRLVAQMPPMDLPVSSVPPIEIPEQPDLPKCGLTGWCVAKNEIIRLHGSELHNHPAVSGRATYEHLPSGKCYSILAVPLQLKKNRPLGLLKIDNKFGPSGLPSNDYAFTNVDEFYARILATKVAAQLDTRRLIDALRKLTEEGHACHDPQQYYEIVLRTGMELLRCDRAMLALLDHNERDVSMAATVNSNATNKSYTVLPRPSIMRSCWERQESTSTVLLEDISDPRFVDVYHSYDTNTRSEAVIRIDWEGVRVGVLNFESNYIGHFDQHDLETLSTLAPFIAAAYRTDDKESHYLHILRELGTYGSSRRSILQHLLQMALTSFGFANGHIFVPSSDGSELVLEARVGPNDVDEMKIPRYKLDDNTKSVQKKVFQSQKHHFAEDAETDAAFNPVGRKVLRVCGSYICIPLLSDDRAVGVLSVWGGTTRQPKESDVPHFKHYAQVAAEVVAVANQHNTFHMAIKEAIPTLQSPSRPEEVWPKILRLVQQSGFDRVRIYLYQPEMVRFEMVASIGPDNPHVGSLVDAKPKGSPYARDIVLRAKTSQDVIVYPTKEIGPDPDADRIGKQADLPWIAIPLICHGRLYGQIAADNAVTRRAIRGETLNNLGLIGSVAALTLAQAETVARLQWTSLDKLHESIHYGDSEYSVVRKLLVYLTDGSAFSFSRAAFFEHQADQNEYRYMTGLGSHTEERFRDVARIASTNGIEYNLVNAERHTDLELDSLFKRCSITQSDLGKLGFQVDKQDALVFVPNQRRNWPEWVRKIASNINSSGLMIVPIVGTDDRVYGLFIVDREWQDRSVSEADSTSLTNFGKYAALQLGQREAAARELEAKHGEVWKDVSLATSHRINTPISTIETEIETLKDILSDHIDSDVRNSLANIAVAIKNAKTMSNQFRNLRDIYHRNADARPTKSRLCDLLERAREKSDDPAKVSITCYPDLFYYGFPTGLEECLDELLSNALYWAAKGNLDPLVRVAVDEIRLPYLQTRSVRRCVRIHVDDNGPGMPLDKVKSVGMSIMTSGRPGGSGFGLFFVREIVRALGGYVTATNLDKGMRFELIVPQVADDTPAILSNEEDDSWHTL